MRTTIDLDDSLLARLREEAHNQGITFRSFLHRVIQRGLDVPAPQSEARYRAPSLSLGRVREGIDLVKARDVAAALGDEEITRKLTQRR